MERSEFNRGNLRTTLSDVYPVKSRVADSPEARFHRGAAGTFLGQPGEIDFTFHWPGRFSQINADFMA